MAEKNGYGMGGHWNQERVGKMGMHMNKKLAW